MLFTILFLMVDYNALDHIVDHFSKISFGLSESRMTIWAIVPVIMVGLPSAAQTVQVFGKANVKKRQLFTFLIFFLILSLVSAIFINGSVLLQVWPLLSLSVFIVNLVHYIRKQWLKDMVYLLLFVALLLGTLF